MATLDTLAARTPGRPDHTCSVCWALQTLPTTAAAYLESALDNPGVTLAEISRALTDEGHPVASVTVGRHRRAECAGRRDAA